MKPEINAATEFLSRIFLAHDNMPKEKVLEFKQQLSVLLEERFRDHWHENCPTKGQAYRCIRVCPEEPLDPVLEKACTDVGINAGDFKLPFELTLWVDPTEVVCKFGDLKCSYHTVAKKDHSSGNLNNQTDKLDIDDLVETARDLYLKKQTVVIHPVLTTEMHIPNYYPEGSPNGFTMAIRINGTMHYNMSGSPPPDYDDSPQGKDRSHSGSKRGGCHYYGKSSGVKGTYMASSPTQGSGSHISSNHNGYQHHRNHHYHSSSSNGCLTLTSAYSNGYGGEDNGYSFDQQSVSPSKVNGMPPLASISGPGQIFHTSPTPEQIQQQVQHPPPMPPPIPHLQQTFSHPSTDINTLPPPPPQQQPLTSCTTTNTTTITNSSNSNSVANGKTSNIGSSSSKFASNRGNPSSKSKQTNAVKEVK
uniref:Anti-proliferative protein domain-containing protein n=1 Tax=Arion vulgaris TaxID=1028688 RepID=A0A0B7AWM7_9EUPU